MSQETKDYIQQLPEIIYPVIKGEQQVEISPVAMAVKGGAYYFSPEFKRKEFLIDELLEKYRRNPRNWWSRNSRKGLYIRNRRAETGTFEAFSEKKKEIINAINSVVFKTGAYSVPVYDVLAYLETAGGCFLLTAEGLYSPTKLEEYGRCIQLQKITKIGKNGLIGRDNICCRETFPTDFIKLAKELIALNSKIDYISEKHPLSTEIEEIREQYIAFLAWRLCAAESMQACAIIRMEILARQLKISSGKLSGIITHILKKRKLYKNNFVGFFDEAFEVLKYDVTTLKNILYCDLAAFDLYGRENKKKFQISPFIGEAASRLGIAQEFTENYLNCWKHLEKNNFNLPELQEFMAEQDKVIRQMAEFEAEVQKNLNGGRYNGDDEGEQ